jgi:hypothetical protein
VEENVMTDITDEQIDALDTFCLSWLAPRGKESVREFARAVLALASEARAAPSPGLPTAQEPKYTVNGSHIVNRASGEAIPHDEPVFIFRARDKLAVRALLDYAARCTGEHFSAVRKRVKHFRAFASWHPERMKQPDTASPPPVTTAREQECGWPGCAVHHPCAKKCARDEASATGAEPTEGIELSEQWRWNLHNFLDVAAGEGYVLGGVDAADLYQAVFPDEYNAALATPTSAPVQAEGPSEDEMVHAAYGVYGYQKGTGKAIAFNDGARWMREALAAAPVHEGLTAEFELWQIGDDEDMFLAGTEGPRAQAFAEIMRYYAQYAQDGRVKVLEVSRKEVQP